MAGETFEVLRLYVCDLYRHGMTGQLRIDEASCAWTVRLELWPASSSVKSSPMSFREARSRLVA